VVERPYVPNAGDLVWVNFSPQVGHEQAGRRPALVLSPRAYNQKAGLAVMCPLTRQSKGYPFEVFLRGSHRFRGVVLADQLRSLDWKNRQAEKAGRISSEILEQVRAKLTLLLGIS
jgi:mRNA interferase MazF